MSEQEENVTVKIYFISGLTGELTVTKSFWIELENDLMKDWNSARYVGIGGGVNFDAVSHYTVMK